MTPQEEKFRQYHADIIAAFRTAFPNLEPPATSWIQLWLTRYSFMGVLDAIRILRNHDPHILARYTQESVGRAVSARLREEALKRALANVQSSDDKAAQS